MTVQERFEAFHKDNPDIFELFRQFALELKAAGWRRYSSKAILNRIRWHHDVNPQRDEGFKLNDLFTSRYARLLMQEEAFADFFELRRIRMQ